MAFKKTGRDAHEGHIEFVDAPGTTPQRATTEERRTSRAQLGVAKCAVCGRTDGTCEHLKAPATSNGSTH